MASTTSCDQSLVLSRAPITAGRFDDFSAVRKQARGDVGVGEPGPVRLEITQTRLRMTTRGRRVLLALVAVPLIAATLWWGFFGQATSASAVSGQSVASAGEVSTVLTVMPGDTLWNIAAELAPQRDPRDVMAEVIEFNDLRSSALTVGQRLVVPGSIADAG